MNNQIRIFTFLFCCISFIGVCQQKENTYKKIGDIPVPDGYKRISVSSRSFGEFLRGISLKKNTTVYLYDGSEKINQDAQFAVLDIDVGKKDLQQCADAVIRLRAEYLYKEKKYDSIHFNFTNGLNVEYKMYAKGNRLQPKGNTFYWKKTTSPDYSYPTFKKYLELIFSYAGTLSLNKELKIISSISNIQIGNVFIRGGSPGHAIIVVDVAIHSKTGKKIILLAQSYMPAQDIHILINPNDSKLSPWYEIENNESELVTPEWAFEKKDLKRF